MKMVKEQRAKPQHLWLVQTKAPAGSKFRSLFVLYRPLSLHINNGENGDPGEFKGLKSRGCRSSWDSQQELQQQSCVAREWLWVTILALCFSEVAVGATIFENALEYRCYRRSGSWRISISSPKSHGSHGKVRGNVGSKSPATVCLLWVGLRSIGRKSFPTLVVVGMCQRMPTMPPYLPRSYLQKQRLHDSSFSSVLQASDPSRSRP
jgi:hypothetical protein